MHDANAVNWGGVFCLLMLMVWFPMYGLGSVLLRWYRRRVVREAKLLLMPAAVFPHRCRIDLADSDVRVDADGSIVAQCAVIGCMCVVEMAPNMRGVTVAGTAEQGQISYSDDHTG